MSDELEFSANYTLSKTYDDASDFNEQPQNPFDLRSERAVSLQHQQQRLTFNALWELPIGDEEPNKPARHDWLTRVLGHIEVAPILSIESGRPVNPLTGVDSNGSHAFPLSTRPPGFGRNSLRIPMLANLDFRVLKYFPFGKTARLDLVGETFYSITPTWPRSTLSSVPGPVRFPHSYSRSPALVPDGFSFRSTSNSRF